MEEKKSKKANLERNRSSILLIGLVCATSTALMSFEYAKYELKQEDNLMSSLTSDELVWELIEPKIEYQSAEAPVEQSKSDYVESDPNPDPDPVPEPDPEPTPEPGPVIGPPGPVVGIKVPEKKPEIDDDNEYVVVEEMPEFPGGIEAMYKFLQDNIKYPQPCVDNGIQGKPYVKFTVEKDGSISNISVIEQTSAHKLLDKEAIRVVGMMPKWKPGRQLNKVVRVSYTLPINFILD